MEKIIYLSLSDHVRLTFFKDQAIILDLKKDKYYVLIEKLSRILYSSLMNGLLLENDRYRLAGSDLNADLSNKFIQDLIAKDILSKKNKPSLKSSHISKEEGKSGLENVDWRLPTSGVTISLFRPAVLKCYLTLIKVHFSLKLFGFYGLIKMVKRNRPPDELSVQPSAQDLKNLSDNLNKACLLFPKKIKCLEWATSFVLMSLSYKWPCNLVIGVQNFPFLAHAWVEYNNEVIFDDKLLPTHLSIMLAEPFKKSTLI